MKSTSYKVQIKASVNGTTVSPKQIAWIHGNDSCLAMPCYKENDYFVIEIIPDCIGGNCIEGYITFGSECDNCEPVYFKKCFCSNSDDCSSCEECNQFGICQSICLADEFCDGDKCSECSDDIKCPCNKICINGGCTCPQNMFEKDGCCVECDSKTILSKCEECVNGVIRQKDCAGACDPTTGECVGCLTGGDCSGREDGKTCCKDKVCVCCEGTVWDPNTQKCIPQPCKDDAECGTCKKCTAEGCKPIECPVGYQCIGDECVPECANTTCNNGADCGENCGCLNGECVPCTILSCLDEASCQAALGCKCNGAACEPVDNCNQYCDGSTPCLDERCTCYNNNCVSCENFPCVDGEGGCNSYYNCKCNDENKCEGGKDCEDTFVLNKLESCSTDGCALQAVYTSKNKCMCDPIEFKVANTKVCSENPQTDPILLNLSVKMFKRGVEYSQFKNSDKFSNDELVTGSIKVVTTVGTSSTTVTKDVSAENTIPTITIPKPDLTNSTTKVVQVAVFSHSIKVGANGCTAYDNKRIAYYEFDFSKTQIENCAKLNTYKTEQVFKINDTKSTKKPLVIWYRTSGDDFGTTPVSLTSTNYNDKGFFRKLYLTGLGGTFSDKIVKPEEGLLNNFRYKVTIDCGCDGANVATTGDVVIYCCPKDLTFTSDGSCGKTVKLQPFTNCSVNKDLDKTKYPVESKTKYVVSVNGKAGKELSSFQTVGSEINITDTDPIKSVEFYQEYDGNAVVKKACSKKFDFNPTLPEFTLNTTEACSTGKVVVTNANININIQSVLAKVGTKTYNFTKTGNLYIATIPPADLINVQLTVDVTFTNGCSNTKTVTVVCAPSITTDAEPSQFARGTCPAGGDNPKIVVTASGFTNNALYSLNNGPFQNSNEFLNVPAGTYTITAKETINGTEYSTTDEITILPAIIPTVSLSPTNICTGQTSTLSITGVQGSVFSVYAPNGSVLTTVTIPVLPSITLWSNDPSGSGIDPTGTVTVPGLNQPGTYTVTLVPPLSTNKPVKDSSCFPTSSQVTLEVGGQQLNPTIEIEPGPLCVGNPIRFRITDGGANATYNLSTLGTGTITTPLQADPFSYNGVFTPTSTQGSIKIDSAVGNCNTIPPTLTPTLPISSSPVITSSTSTCQPNNQHTVTVVVTGATSVTIGGVAATNTSTNTWQRTNITGLTNVNIIASNGTCEARSALTLQNCLFPQGIVIIDTTGDTCGQGLTNIYYNGASGITPNSSWNYIFQGFALGEWGNIGTIAVFNPLNPPNLSTPTTIGVNDQYRLKLINTINGAEYFSDPVTVTAVQPPLGLSITSNPSQPFITGVPITFSVVPANPSYTYSWTDDTNGSSSTSDPVIFTNPGSYLAKVDVCSAAGCCDSVSLPFTVGENCTSPITLNVNPFTECTDNIKVVVLGGGSGSKNYTVSGTYINIPSTNVPINNEILIPVSTLNPGDSDTLTLIVSRATGSPCTVQTTINYTRVECLAANIVYFIDNSGSIDASEFNSMKTHIANSSQEIYDRSNNCTFSVVHYGTVLPHLQANAGFSIVTNASSLPIGVGDITRPYGPTGADYLQTSLELFITDSVNGLSSLNLNPSLPNYLLLYSDAVGSISSSLIGDYMINTLNSNDNDSSDGTLGINEMTYTWSDDLKDNYDFKIIVIRYPGGGNQLLADAAFQEVASTPQDFYPSIFSNDVTESILNSLNCSCP